MAWWFLTALMTLVLASPSVAKQSAGEARFYATDAAYAAFLKDGAKTKLRDNWFGFARDFEAAYKEDPSGKLAAASLFMAGKTWLDLSQRSGLSSDARQGADFLQRVVKRFPDSLYRQRADEELAKLSARAGGTIGGVASPAQPPEDGRHIRPRTTKSPETAATPASGDTGGAPAGVPRKTPNPDVRASKIAYHDAGREKDAVQDKKTEPEPDGARGKVSDEIARILEKRAAVEADLRKAASAKRAKAEEPPAETGTATPSPSPPVSPGDMAVINGLRAWSNPNYTRIVIDADRETTYTHEFLDHDSGEGKPQRLYVDFAGSRLGQDIDKRLPIDDNLLEGARAGQLRPDAVRVVVDIKSYRTYKIFSLKNPFRIIIDVWGGENRPIRETPPPDQSQAVASSSDSRFQPYYQPPPAKERTPPPPEPMPDTQPQGRLTPHDLARQLALGVRRVVIDPGHGGHDPGAIGYDRRVREKDVNLALARRLAEKIRRELGCEVILTRDKDVFLSLEERTAIANTKNADLFISIHCNASRNSKAHGLETYFLNLATDEDAVLVAARENATSRKNISELQGILHDLMRNAKINESSRLAAHVQQEMVSHMRDRYGDIANKGVKKAPFYVLLGAQMPSILVEVAFISNQRECLRLVDGDYQDHLVNGIMRGVRRYIKETNPTAFSDPPGGRGRKG